VVTPEDRAGHFALSWPAGQFNKKQTANSKNLRLNGHTSFEFQTRNYIM